MAKKSRAAARKVKDKWKAKNWYNLIAPTMFNKALIGETLADDPELLMGRVSEVTVQDITGDFSKMHIKLAFKVQDIRGSDAHTQFVGHDLTSDYVRRLTRRKKTRTDTTLDITTKDGTKLKVKPMAIADRRIQSSKQTAIREIMRRVFASPKLLPSASFLKRNLNLKRDLRRILEKKHRLKRVLKVNPRKRLFRMKRRLSRNPPRRFPRRRNPRKNPFPR
jgi:small subunit ribosomal protein S3Ae